MIDNTGVGYKKLIESKLVRIQHKIVFREGMAAVDFTAMLKHVPPGAKIIEFDNGADYSDESKNCLPSILFEEERAVE